MIKKILIFLAIFLFLIVGFFVWKFYFRFLTPFPHKGIVITLPFAKEDDDLIFINPMGETDHHDPPRGHPGLDFGWHRPAPLRASAGGKITKVDVFHNKGEGVMEEVYNVEIVSDLYAIRYQEIAPISSLRVGMSVNQGDIIGRGGKYNQPGGLGIYYSTHWEFDYDTFIFDRLCPLTYFDNDSLIRINVIWDKVGQKYEGLFPEICNGFYKGRDK